MTETLLLDTDVTSFLLKGSQYAESYRPIVEGKRLALSFMSVAQLYKWTLKRNWGAKKIKELGAALRRYVIVPYDSELAWAWARVMATCEANGRTIGTSDGWIAATAIRHSLRLLTNNLRHFEPVEQWCGCTTCWAQLPFTAPWL